MENITDLQAFIARKLNEEFPDPWRADKATTRHGEEYIRFENEETKVMFVISLVEGC